MRIHLIDGEKGGVGKSWFAFVVAEYLRAKLIAFYLYAADRSNPTAASRYKDKERLIVVDFPKLADSKRIKINANRWTFEEAIELGNFGIVGNSDIHNYMKKANRVLESTCLLEV
jgi:hypothetical protein